jgi:hypothetical protein
LTLLSLYILGCTRVLKKRTGTNNIKGSKQKPKGQKCIENRAKTGGKRGKHGKKKEGKKKHFLFSDLV